MIQGLGFRVQGLGSGIRNQETRTPIPNPSSLAKRLFLLIPYGLGCKNHSMKVCWVMLSLRVGVSIKVP